MPRKLETCFADATPKEVRTFEMVLEKMQARREARDKKRDINADWIDSFAAAISDPATGATLSPVERMHIYSKRLKVADRVGLDVFGIGEHHRAEFLDSAPVVILSAPLRGRKISV